MEFMDRLFEYCEDFMALKGDYGDNMSNAVICLCCSMSFLSRVVDIPTYPQYWDCHNS